MVFQDGQAFHRLTGDYRVPYVLDNLIYRREIPVMIAVFINPGRTNEQPMASASAWGDGAISNRGVEYNALDDKYTKVIVDELLPVLSKNYNISSNPEDRGIGGASSGAIAAFTVAWHRPDRFRKVLSTIGSFTNIRGGHVYPDLVRQTEKKPLRIFLQDGMNDQRGAGGGRGRGARGGNNAGAATPPGTAATANAGAPPAAAAPAPADPATAAAPPAPTYNAERDWHAQNRKMVAALTEKGYDVNYVWGIGTHNNKHGGAILPDMMRWLWRDYPRPPDDPRDATHRGFLVPAGYVAPTPAAAPAATSPPAATPSAKQ
ncbi:MAG: alpha/beta hydrolase-fold protein [Opitutaceae bacterium]